MFTAKDSLVTKFKISINYSLTKNAKIQFVAVKKRQEVI